MNRILHRILHRVMQLKKGSVIGQPGIRFGLPHLFRGDGVPLSPGGCNVYLANLASGTEAVFTGMGWQGKSS